ncbi:hypothetical protein HY991_05530, partial [Candidatus Micrarchaeota archaeon]|nr:hypothetical protein [Candidatus Micrarchaeota archaeon]
ASEFKDRGDYSNAVEKLYSAKKALQEKLAGNAPTQGTLDVEAQRTIGLSGAALALVFLAYSYLRRRRNLRPGASEPTYESKKKTGEW